MPRGYAPVSTHATHAGCPRRPTPSGRGAGARPFHNRVGPDAVWRGAQAVNSAINNAVLVEAEKLNGMTGILAERAYTMAREGRGEEGIDLLMGKSNPDGISPAIFMRLHSL